MEPPGQGLTIYEIHPSLLAICATGTLDFVAINLKLVHVSVTELLGNSSSYGVFIDFKLCAAVKYVRSTTRGWNSMTNSRERTMSKLDRFPSSCGIDPSNRLPPTLSSLSGRKVAPKQEGSSPLISFSEIENSSSASILQISTGILPVNRLFERSNLSMTSDNKPRDLGIVPYIRLPSISNLRRPDIFPSSSAMDPLKS